MEEGSLWKKMYGFLCFLTVTFWFLASYQSQFMLVIWKCQWAKWAHSVIATTKNVKKVKKMDVEQVKVNVRWKAPLLLEVLPEAWLVHIQALHFSHVPYEAWSHQHHQHLCIYTYIRYIHIYNIVWVLSNRTTYLTHPPSIMSPSTTALQRN